MSKLDQHTFCTLCGCHVPETIVCSDSECPLDPSNDFDEEDYVKAVDFNNLQDERGEQDDPLQHFDDLMQGD